MFDRNFTLHPRSTLALASSGASAFDVRQRIMDKASYTIEKIPGAFRKGIAVVAPVLILLVVSASMGLVLQSSHPDISRYLGIVFVILICVFIVLTIFHRPASRSCPRCHHTMAVDTRRTTSGSFSMTCEHCKVIWDLGYGTGE